MYKQFILKGLALVLALGASRAFAQCGCDVVAQVYAPVVSGYTSYYAPSVTYYTPTPSVAYYAPETHVTYYAPAPTVSDYSPVSYANCYTPAVRYATYCVSPAVYETPVVRSYPVYYTDPACGCSP